MIKEKVDIVIFRYSPITINLYKLQGAKIIIAPTSQKNNYDFMVQKYNFMNKVYYVENMNMEYVISILDKINLHYSIASITTLSEDDIEWIGLLNDYYVGNCSRYVNNSLFRNKYYMRCFLKDIVKEPIFIMPNSINELMNFLEYNKEYVIKPINGEGAQGVTFFKLEDVRNNTDFFKEKLSSKSFLIEEKVLNPKMITCDGYAVGKKIIRFFIHEYNDLITNALSQNSYTAIFTSDINTIYDKKYQIKGLCQKVLNRLGMENELTPFHFEWFYSGNEFVFCEVAKRFGGANIPQLINESYNIDILNEYWNESFPSDIDSSDKLHPHKLSCCILAYAKKGTLKSVPNLPKSLKCKFKIYKCFVKEGDFCEDSKELSNQLFSCMFTSNSLEEQNKTIDETIEFKNLFTFC